MTTDLALELLKDAGLSGYEAKVYVALLAAGEPMNGYEVAKASGVPRSTVYETLAKLVARGAGFEVSDADSSVSYVAIPADTLVGRLRRQTTATIEGLERVLPSIGKAMAARVVQHLAGLDAMVTRAVDVIDGAQQSLWLSVWPQESDRFVDPIAAAVERGVDVFVIGYGDVSPMAGRVYTHTFSAPDVIEQRLQCRLSIVVADHDQALIGGVTPDASWGMWSDDPAVALLAAEHVRHDIALQLTAEHLAAAGAPDFWTGNPDLEALRDASAAAVAASLRR